MDWKKPAVVIGGGAAAVLLAKKAMAKPAPAKTPTSMTTTTTPPDKTAVDQSFPFAGNLKDENGNPLSGKTIELHVNDSVTATTTTNPEGVWSFKVTPTGSGSMTVQAVFPGDADYEGC